MNSETHNRRKQAILKALLPVAVLICLGLVALVLLSNPPEANVKRPPDTRLMVEVLPLAQRDFEIMLESYGTVAPRTRSMLTSEVSGQIRWIAPGFRDGGAFSEDDVLVRIDKRVYEANVRIAEAAYMEARQRLAEEQARANQAEIDWQKLGEPGSAPDLVLRRPQLLAAEARLGSAEASRDNAQLDLERAEIKAPFDGRVLSKHVDIGQVVAPNQQLAEVYATDYVEIRLPLKNRDLEFIDLPGVTGESLSPERQLRARIASELGGAFQWQGRIVRTEAAIDASARQLHVIAQVDSPFSQAGARPPLRIGQYVTARIQGRRLGEAVVVPTSAIYQQTYAYVVSDDVLDRRLVDIAWQDDSEALIRSGLDAGDLLVTTPLGQIVSGTPVRIVDANEVQARPAPLDARSRRGTRRVLIRVHIRCAQASRHLSQRARGHRGASPRRGRR